VKGWRRTVSAVAGSALAYRRWYVFWTRLEPTVPSAAPRGREYACRLATLADLDSLAVFAPHRGRRDFRHWLETGSRLFLALDGAVPVAYHCMTSDPPVIPPLSRIRLTGDQLWFEEMYVLPEHRRRHASTQLRRYRERCLREWGYQEIVSGVHARNLPALHLIHAYNQVYNLGQLRRVERHTCLTALGWSRVWVDEDALPMLETQLRRAGLLESRPAPRPASP
jgi:GNAT superfamily N-acetyltransferase